VFAWRRERLILLAKALEVGRVYGEGSTGSCWREEFSVQESIREASLVVQWLRSVLHMQGPGPIPGQGTRSHMLHATEDPSCHD